MTNRTQPRSTPSGACNTRNVAAIVLGTAAAAGIVFAVIPLRRRRKAKATVAASQPESPLQQQLDDDTVQRIARVRIGTVAKQLHLPSVHLTVGHHVATLHGQVRTRSEAGIIEDAVAAVPGVSGVVSHLDEGLPADEAADKSQTLRELLAAARGAGCSEAAAPAAVRTLLAIFVEHLPQATRKALLDQLPADVRHLAISPRRMGVAVGLLPNTLDTLVDAVASVVAVPRETAHEVTIDVLQTLQAALPADTGDIRAYLPHELADVWCVSASPQRTPTDT